MSYDALRYIINNFDCFGFGSTEGAFLQCAKELIENGLDACKQSRGNFQVNSSVVVDVRIDKVYLWLEVSDSGTGITEPLQILRCFSTNKDFSTKVNDVVKNTSGKFGVGLSACVLYSQVHTNTPLRIRTRVSDQSSWKLFDVKFAANSEPHLVNEEILSGVVLGKGSSITLKLPRPSPTFEDSAIEAIRLYLHRLKYIPTNTTRTELLLCKPSSNTYQDISGDVNEYGKEHGDNLIHEIFECCPISRTTHPNYNNDDESFYADRIHNLILEDLSEEPDRVVLGTAASFYSPDAGDIEIRVACSLLGSKQCTYDRNPSMKIRNNTAAIVDGITADIRNKTERDVGVLVANIPRACASQDLMKLASDNSPSHFLKDVHSPVTDTEPAENSESDVEASQENREGCQTATASQDQALELFVWRYANGYPLLDLGDDALSCQLVSAVRQFPWSQYGHKMTMEALDTGIGKRGGTGRSGHADQSEPLLRSPCCRLLPLWDHLEREGEMEGLEKDKAQGKRNDSNTKPESLVLIIDLISEAIPYANMKKSAIAGNRTIEKSLTKALQNCMNSLQNRLGENVFMSKRQYEEKKLYGLYLPAIARGLAKIIRFQRVEGQDRSLEYLGLSSEENIEETTLIQHIETRLTDVYERNRPGKNKASRSRNGKRFSFVDNTETDDIGRDGSDFEGDAAGGVYCVRSEASDGTVDLDIFENEEGVINEMEEDEYERDTVEKEGSSHVEDSCVDFQDAFF